MAHIKVSRIPDSTGGVSISINGSDVTDEIYAGSIQLVTQGDGLGAEVALQLRIAVSRLDLGEQEDVDVAALLGSWVRPAPTTDRLKPLFPAIPDRGQGRGVDWLEDES